MSKEEFKQYLKQWYINNSKDKLMHTNYFVDKRLHEIETSDSEGDFIFENNNVVIGKYFYCEELPKTVTADNQSRLLRFYIYGLGTKDENGDLEDYEEFEYIIL